MAVPTQFAYRTLKDINVINAAPVYEPLPGFNRPEGHLRCCAYSPCGRYFAWASPEGVTVIDASVGFVVTNLPVANVFELAFSPQGSFIITWERPGKDEQGDALKNLKVWRVVEPEAAEDGKDPSPVGKFVQKAQTGCNLQYTDDERLCARTVTNEVQFNESHDLGTVWNKLHVEGLTQFELSQGKEQSVAVFIPERKGQPAAVKVFKVPRFDAPVSQKTFYKGDKVKLKWNKTGTSLIVLAQTEVDKSNKSYDGETNMYILSANGGFDSRIQLDKEGPIYDVTWSPNSKEFGVVYGWMPAKATIFNERAVATHEFPLKPRNTISFSPHGRFVLVAGFGNLAGQMDIYDLEKDFAKVTTIEADSATVCEWSPDGKYILTATTSPRLRVDNGVRIWHVGGGLMYNAELAELYHILWRPQSTTTHPLVGNPLHPMPTPHASASTFLAKAKTPSKPAGAYRPPGARGQVTPLHFKREDEGGVAHIASNGAPPSSHAANGFGPSRPRGRRDVPGAEAATESLPPGTAPGGGVSLVGATGDGDEGGLSKAALKNKKKREAKKAKEAADRAAAVTGGAGVDAEGGEHRGAIEARGPPRGPRRGSRSRSRNRYGEGQGNEPHHRRGPSQGEHFGHPQQGYGSPMNGGSHYPHQNPPTGPRGIAMRPGSSTSPNKPLPPHLRNPAPPHKAVHSTTATDGPSQPVPAPAAPLPEVTVVSPGGGTANEKKLRGLLKKLRAIDDLKMRLAGGEKLEDTQMKKIGTEEGVRSELVGLGWNG